MLKPPRGVAGFKPIKQILKFYKNVKSVLDIVAYNGYNVLNKIFEGGYKMKYEGFKVSKEVENKSKEMEREFKAKDIMEFQAMLEMHNKSLGNFMVNRIDYDWNKNPLWVALYNILKATMIQDKGGHWIDK